MVAPAMESEQILVFQCEVAQFYYCSMLGSCLSSTSECSRSGLSGYVKLCFISIGMKMDTIVPKHVAQREGVNNK